MAANLRDFRVDVDPDRNDDPYLIHEECGDMICTVQHDDTLAVLVAVAEDHECEYRREGE